MPTDNRTQMEQLTDIFEKTFADKKVSRNERKALTRLLEDGEIPLDRTRRDILKSQIFEIARNGLRGEGDRNVVDWLETLMKLLCNCGDSTVYFSPGKECRNAIVSQLKETVKSADICVFTISDNDIAEAIRHCHGRGVKIRIITDNDKADDSGSDIYKLQNSNIPVRIDRTLNHMHHKFAVFDNERVLTGSYNWTRSAAEYNQENILLSDHQPTVKAFQQEFEKLWHQFDTSR